MGLVGFGAVFGALWPAAIPLGSQWGSGCALLLGGLALGLFKEEVQSPMQPGGGICTILETGDKGRRRHTRGDKTGEEAIPTG